MGYLPPPVVVVVDVVGVPLESGVVVVCVSVCVDGVVAGGVTVTFVGGLFFSITVVGGLSGCTSVVQPETARTISATNVIGTRLLNFMCISPLVSFVIAWLYDGTSFLTVPEESDGIASGLAYAC